jgi:hypothetical protein
MPFDTDQIMWAATTADDDPMYPCTGFQHYHSVWFQYTPTANGILFLDTEGSDYDTVLAVWAGTRGALTNIACNDDINLSENLQSLVELATFADTTYYIEVTSYSENPTGTLVLSAEYITPTFVDVPFDHPLHDYIEALYQAGYTAGCSTDPLMYCPEQVMNRGMSAVFMLRGHLGVDYVPPPEPWDTFTDDWSLSDISWAEKWAEGMWVEGLTAGCLADPLMYCPRRELPRVEASVFGLRMMHGVDYTPPPASGTLFADMTDTSYWGTKWAEQAYLDGLLPACGEQDGKPMFCPDELVDRGWGAYLIVQARDLPLP